MSIVPAIGPSPCSCLLVGEAPGEKEAIAKVPFIGKAGSVLTSYLLAAGISRSDVRVTNLYPFWPGPGNPDPTAEQIAAEEWRLISEMKRTKPSVIAAIGRLAARWFLGDVDMETVHGIPLPSARFPGLTVVACYHPAAGFYDPAKAALSQDDFLRLAYVITNPANHALKRSRFSIRDSRLRGVYKLDGGALDTEGTVAKPWGLSATKDGRKAEVARVGRKPRSGLKLVGRVAFHNALYDLGVLRSLGFDTRSVEFDDTMVMAYVLQLEPQGLKALAHRHLGMKMLEFDEVVRPHFNRLALRWLKSAAKREYPKPEPVAVQDYAQRKNRIYRPQSMGRRIANLLRSFEKDSTTRLDKGWREIGKTAWVDQTAEYQAMAERVVGRPFPEFSLSVVPLKKAVRYSGTDAIATHRLKPVLLKRLQAKGLEQVYEMDRRALAFIDRCQEVGMRVDREKLWDLQAGLEAAKEQHASLVRSVIGDKWFNPGSGDQVARWLYEVKRLIPAEYTDTGRGSTRDEALQMLRGQHEHSDDPEIGAFISGVQQYREAEKVLGTFVLPILKFARPDRNGDYRIHPNIRATRVVSGRLSAFDPNVLAIPTRSTLGKMVRGCFVARDGWVVLATDLSQIELRTGAHLSGDQRMRQAFQRGEDLHALTASLIWRIGLSLVSAVQRYVAKTINFATFYGISAKALLEQLWKAEIFDYRLEDCDRFIREWFEAYGGVRTWQNRLWKNAEEEGCVRTMWGRICYLPNLRVMDNRLRESAQRLAANFPVQGSAADLVKRAQTRLHDFIEGAELREGVQPWLQMHDEIIVEAREERAEETAREIEIMMTMDQGMFSVPIQAKSAWGKSWAEAK